MIRSQLVIYLVLDILTRFSKYAVVEQFKQIFLEVVCCCLCHVFIKLYVRSHPGCLLE